MSREAMKLALEALAVKFSEGWHEGIKIDASDIMLLNDAAQALAEQPAQQEPVAWIYKPHMELLWPDEIEVKNPSKHRGYKPLYSSPQEQRKPLTGAEIRKWWSSENGLEDCRMAKLDDFEKVVRAIEAAHGIKENT